MTEKRCVIPPLPEDVTVIKTQKSRKEPLLVLLQLRGATEHQAPQSWQRQGPTYEGHAVPCPRPTNLFCPSNASSWGWQEHRPTTAGRTESSTDNLNMFQKKINQGAKSERRRRVGKERMRGSDIGCSYYEQHQHLSSTLLERNRRVQK